MHLFGYCLQQTSSSITNGSIPGDMPLDRLSGHPHSPSDAQHVLHHKELAVDAIYDRHAYSDEKPWLSANGAVLKGGVAGRCSEWFASVSTLGGYLWDERLHGQHVLERVREL
ncbi:hypothetical protein PSEUDO8AS_10008 [Pseudomonas sp. 8AS]|nr:hypothetical protein PSEUDO8AS_10008 [Pseudomonas sp. 8AS]